MPDFVFVAGLADDWRCRYWCVTYDLRGCHCEVRRWSAYGGWQSRAIEACRLLRFARNDIHHLSRDKAVVSSFVSGVRENHIQNCPLNLWAVSFVIGGHSIG